MHTGVPAVDTRERRRKCIRLTGLLLGLTVVAAVAKGLLLRGEQSGEGEASSSQAHYHKGVLPPFKLGPVANLKAFSRDELQQLEAGRLVLRQQEDTTRGKGLAVRDIAASPDDIMEELLEFHRYNKKVAMCSKSNVYSRAKVAGGKERVKVEMASTLLPGWSFNCFFDHLVDRKGHSMIWSLDYQRRSDVDDIQGMWYVAPHPTKPGWSRVFYQIDMKLRYKVPAMLYRALAKSSLSNAVSWVKEHSERRAASRR